MGRETLTASGDLKMTVDDSEGSTLVRLNGRLNIHSSPMLRDRLIAMLGGGPPKIVMVDLANVSYIDASGIATMIEALKIARNHQSELRLKGLQGRVLHLFEVTGMLPLFETSSPGSSSAVSKVL